MNGTTGQRLLTATRKYGELGLDEKNSILLQCPYALLKSTDGVSYVQEMWHSPKTETTMVYLNRTTIHRDNIPYPPTWN